MKNRALPQSIVAAAVLMAAFILCAPAAQAQDAPAAAVREPAGYALEIENGMLVDRLRKDRGYEATLGSVVDVLREKYTHANIVMAPGLAKVKISDLKLRALDLREELEAIREASGKAFDWRGPGDRGDHSAEHVIPFQMTGVAPVDPTTGLPEAEARNSGLFVLSESAVENARTFEVFNVGRYLERVRKNKSEAEVASELEQIEKIIGETLADLDPGAISHSPKYQFHSGANLLVVIGTREEIEVARQVVGALSGEYSLQGSEFYRAFGGGGGGGGSGGSGAYNPFGTDFRREAEAHRQDALKRANGATQGQQDPFVSPPAPGARP